MRAFGIRIPVVLASMAAALALLFGAQLLYDYHTVEAPLHHLFGNQPAVRHVELSDGPKGLVIAVDLGPVENLRDTYQALERRAAAVLGEQHFTLLVRDNRDAQLERALDAIEPIVQEALATGRFVWMTEQVQAAGRRLGLDRAEAIPDSRFVYVQLAKGDRYLYEVVPRQSGAGAGLP